jgi:peptidoglycan/LPS O-acetylase OafA/YrhL
MGVLRLSLALAVVLTHVGYNGIMISGDLAVKIFFMISGFYMALILMGKYGFSSSGLKKFFLNRFLRLYPTYYAALIGTMAWRLFCVWSTHGHANPPHIVIVGNTMSLSDKVLLWLPNFTLIGVDIPCWFNYSISNGLSLYQGGVTPSDLNSSYWLGWTLWIPQAWSIGAELCFYALAPFAIQGKGYRVVALGLISMALWFYIENYLHWWAYFFWPAEFYLFAMGIIAFKVYSVLESKMNPFFGNSFQNLFLLVTIIWIVFMPLTRMPIPEWLLLGSAMLLIPPLFHTTKDSAWDRFIGNLSYPIYCIHMLVWELVCTVIGRFDWSWNLFPLLTVIASIIAGCIVYFLIDHSIERIRVRISSSTRRQRSSSL